MFRLFMCTQSLIFYRLCRKEIVVLSNKATRLLEESVKSTKEIALLKAETVKLEKEISEIKKTKSVVLQSVSTTFSLSYSLHS
jgi:predicted  nucleic acid-binding Zn-ribbon protein